MRTFNTGATRDTDNGKLCYEGFLSPLVLERYAQYMHRNRKQPDGQLRAPDNWQRGIPQAVYADSMIRHVFDFWLVHRGWRPRKALEDLLCAIMFNAMGYLHELCKTMPGPKDREFIEPK